MCVMTCTCALILLKHIWHCWQVQCHSVITWETCFDKSEVLNDFITDVSKSRNRDFCSRKSGDRGTHTFSYLGGRPMNRGKVEMFKQEGWNNEGQHALCLYSNLVISFTGNCVVSFVSSYIMVAFTFGGIKS